MSFIYPLGMLALIAIPVLIIIYIIKNKYTEQVISSTYIWTLSERFLKRKNPLKRITGILSLILQILIIIFIAFSLAQPTFTLSGAAHDYLFVLDGSGSMNIQDDSGTTRLEQGKEQIAEIIDSSANGSTYTLVYASSATSTLCEGESDKSTVLTLLNSINGGYCSTNLTSALSVAQDMFSQNPSLKVYLYTDKDYQSAGSNFTAVNLSSGEENYAVSDVEYTTSGGLTVTGNAWSYESDAVLTVSLYIDGSETAYDTQSVAVTKLAAQQFTLTAEVTSFTSFTVSIAESDALMADNEYTEYSLVSDSAYKTLIVYNASSDQNNVFFLTSALSAFGEMQITSMSSTEYAGDTGYGLYIFDNYTPSVLPSDGAVWFINPAGSVSNTGFSVQNTVTLSYPTLLDFSDSTSARVQSLLSGTESANRQIYVNEYVKCSFSKSFYTLLSCDNNPVLFAGTNSYGNREVVFAFDFHNSDFAISPCYMLLMANLFDYTFPEIVSDTSYYCGDTVEVSVPANCTSIRVETPLGNVSYLDTTGDVAEYTPTEAGTYTITLIISGNTRQVNIYVSLPLEERYTTQTVSSEGAVTAGDAAVAVLSADGSAVTETPFALYGEAQDGARDGYYNELWIWFVVLAVLFIADWGVYCYEQYQLR